MISFTIGKTGRVGLSRKNQLRFRAMCHFLGMLACLSSLSIGAQLRTVRVGIIMDGPWERNEEILEATQREILELTHREFDVRFPPEKIVQADWKAEGVRAAIDRFLADPEVDLIITWGLIGSDIICRLEGLPKPVIAPVVVNVDLQGIPFDPETGTSGVSNLSYVSWPLQRVRADLEKFHEITSFRKLTYLVNAAYPDANPSLPRSIIKAAQRLDFEVELTFVEVGFSAEDALARIPQDTEAVYVAPLLQLSPEEFELLVKDLIERRLPSFSLLGTSDVEQGLMASLSLDTDFDRLSRRIALNLQRILLGEDAGTLPVTFERGERLTINMETARAIRVYPSWSLITEADLLNPEREDIGRHLTLSRVVRDALSTNLDLRAMEHLVAAGIEEIQKARSVLLPRIDLSSLGMFIDGDRAEGSFGSQGRRNLSGSATLTQLVYSEPARANLDIQRHRQTTREERRQQLRLDIALATASAYLNVLRGKTSERIQRENLHRTRRHLAIAQDRLRVGMASRHFSPMGPEKAALFGIKRLTRTTSKPNGGGPYENRV